MRLWAEKVLSKIALPTNEIELVTWKLRKNAIAAKDRNRKNWAVNSNLSQLCLVTFKLPVKAVAKLLAGSRQPVTLCGIIIPFFSCFLQHSFSFEFTCVHTNECVCSEESRIIITTLANENVTHPPWRRSVNAAMKMYNSLKIVHILIY